MKAGLRQNTTTRTNMCTYLGTYPEASTEHQASGSWALREVWRATTAHMGIHPRKGEGTALQLQHQLSSQLRQWLRPPGHSSAQNSTKPPSERFSRLGEGHHQVDSL